jgi:hypothetical protein
MYESGLLKMFPISEKKLSRYLDDKTMYSNNQKYILPSNAKISDDAVINNNHLNDIHAIDDRIVDEMTESNEENYLKSTKG